MPTDMPPAEEEPLATYEHRPKPFSRDLSLRLTRRALTAQRGERPPLVFPLAEIERISLRFSPRNMAHHAFACSVRRRDGVSVGFDSLSWRGLVEVERQDVGYRRFVLALVEATRAAAPAARIETGIGPWRYRLVVAVGAAMAAGLLVLSVVTALERALPAALLALALAAYFGWWLRDFARRNRPGTLAVGEIPERVLPQPAQRTTSTEHAA